MVDQTGKRGRGRPPHPEGALSNATRQRNFARQRARDTAQLAYALKAALNGKAQRDAFIAAYRGTVPGQQLWRALVPLLADDPESLAFFEALIIVT